MRFESRRILTLVCLLLAHVASCASDAAEQPAPRLLEFDFAPRAPQPGHTRVAPGDAYTREHGYGFEPGSVVTAVDRGAAGGFVTDERAFYFSVAVPEGNYKVTVTLGDPTADRTSNTTVKAELRRLMLQDFSTAAGRVEQRSFIVNVRTPNYPGDHVHLKSPRETTDEAWAWDEKLTLEFNGARPCLDALTVESVEVPTVYLLGDSTVCDQSKEPYASWGQMMPRFFKPDVAVANHAESGETVAGATHAHRLDKVLSAAKPGDYVLIQFGHNDMKAKEANGSDAYAAALRKWVEQVRAKHATAVLITPMNRHRFEGASVVNTLRDYPDKVRGVAKEMNVALIDLNAMSKTLYEALGPEGSIDLFAHPAGVKAFDATHHGAYGAYELARCVVEGIRVAHLPLARSILEDLPAFDPAKPDRVAEVRIPPSPGPTGQRPLGD